MQASCEKCGIQPAALVTSRWHLGMIFYGRTTTTQAVLCAPHARSQVLGDLAKTAVLGWWGVLSFFINIGVVFGQIGGLSSAAKIGGPSTPPTAQTESA